MGNNKLLVKVVYTNLCMKLRFIKLIFQINRRMSD